MKLTHKARWRCRWEYGYCVTLMFIAAVAGFRLTHHHKNGATTQQLHHQPLIKPVGLFLSSQQPQPQPNESERLLTTTNDRNRRRVLTTATTAWTTVHSDCPNIAVAASELNMDATAVLNGLQDLPSYDPKTTVRLYLCRHGETDYNRNNMIQGARIDPPINDFGREQAKRLGQVLTRTIVPHSTLTSLSNAKSPVLILHSPLLRAKQTAEVVAEQLRHSTTTTILRPLASLAEVDFGGVAEGAPVSQYRSELLALYTSWAVGNYQARMPAGGESGMEILNRVSQAVYAMINLAADSSPNSALIAIAHSSYLRILLGAVQPPDAAIMSAATTPQSNCCINVIDFPHPTTMTTLATNRFMDGDNSNNVILIPRGNVIRVNEKRHLNALQRSEPPTGKRLSVNSILSSF